MAGWVDPTKEQFKAMMTAGREGPIWMLNLIRLRKTAKYDDGREATGAEAYSAYARESEAFFKGVGGKIVWSGAPELLVIGPDDERWDLCFVAEYPSVSAFGDMLRNPGYQETVAHRRAAVTDSRLLRMKPGAPGKIFG
jgi:uncharacterized protein (DUF1330 family)